MSRLFTIVIIGCLISTNLFGQDRGRRGGGQMPQISIKGKVLDAETSNPLEFATISLYSRRDSSLITGGLTDLDGSFDVQTRPGPQYAVVEFISYEAITLNIEIDRDKLRSGERSIDLGTISMSVSGIALDNIEIRAEKSETQFSLDKRVFNVGQDLANQGGTAQDILDNVPSVTVDIEGAVSLRGSSGVRILIDGKPSGLANQDNANGLRSIPANLIDQVEVITNPSARYEAEGMAGIINIVLKKDKGSGFNGSFDVSGGFPSNAGAGANVNYRKGKINWFANYGLNYRSNPGGGSSLLTQDLSNGGTFFQAIDRDINRSGLSNSLRLGFDFIPNEKEVLTGAFLYRISDEDNLGTLVYDDFLDDYPNNQISSTLRTDNEREDESVLQYSLNYKKEYSSRKHFFEATIQFQNDSEEEASDYLEVAEIFQGNPINDLIQRSSNVEGNKTWLFQADYNQPIGEEGIFEVGLRSSFRMIDNDYLVEELEEGEFITLTGLSNDFNYDEDVHAAYAILGNKTGKLGYQFGLRAEYSDILTELQQTNEVNDRDYLNLFPSTFLNYELSSGSNLQLSYSKRVRRPRFWDLNPFFTFSDSRNFFSGNPDLDPEFTDSYELNYLQYFDDLTITGGFFYRHTKDKIQRVLTFNPDGTTIRRPENLATGDDYGLELTFQYSGLKWLRLDGNANFFRQVVNGQNVNESFSAETTTWFGRFTSRFSFWDSDLQLRFNYRAPRETVQGRSDGIPSLDFGWSKDVLKKQGTLTLSIRDVFNSRKRRGTTFGDGFFRESEFQWRARVATLAFNYRINQKKKRQRPRGDYEGGGEGQF